MRAMSASLLSLATARMADAAAAQREIEAVDAERVRALVADELAALSRIYADDSS